MKDKPEIDEVKQKTAEQFAYFLDALSDGGWNSSDTTTVIIKEI